MSSGHGPAPASGGDADELGTGDASAVPLEAEGVLVLEEGPIPASTSDLGALFPHPIAARATTLSRTRRNPQTPVIGPDARTRAPPRARYAPRVSPPSGPPPAALWVLYRRKPAFDAAAVAASLGTGALVEGSDTMLSVRLRGHSLRVVSLGDPLPEAILEQCLPVAHLRPEQKDELAGHAAHALVLYQGDAPGVDGLVALYETAWALRGDDVLGVMNPVTWMCLTADMLAETVKPEFVDAVRANPAESLALWLGFVKLFRPEGGTWLVTRGGWLAGLPDLAWLAEGPGEADDVHAMFAGILGYVFTSGARLAPGHTIDLEGRALELRAPYEYVDHLGEETLVVAPK